MLLEDLRCDGSAHDGCQAECRVFWKEAWLKRVGGPKAHAGVDEPRRETRPISAGAARFDLEAVGYGTGLQGIADRLAALDGSLDIRSEPGHGTLVTGKVPATPLTTFPTSH